MTTAFLDTCVLVPGRERDVLLEVASTGAYRPTARSSGLRSVQVQALKPGRVGD